MSIGKITIQTDSNNHVISKNDRQKNVSEEVVNEKKLTVIEEKLQQKEQTKDELEKVINSLNKFLEPTNTHLKFELHEKTEEYFVKVINDKTSEIVREIPSEEWLDYYAAMTDFLGLIVDKKI